MTAVVLALAAAALWGTGDFFGGLATGGLNVLIVLFWSQLVGLLGVAVWIGVSGAARPGAVLLCGRSRGSLGRRRARLPLPRDGGRRDGDRGADLGHVADRAARGQRRRRRRADGGAMGGDRVRARRDRARLARAGRCRRTRRVAEGVGLALVAALGFGLFVVGLARRRRRARRGRSRPRASAPSLHSSSRSPGRGRCPRVPRRLVVPVIAVGIFDTGANVLFAVRDDARLDRRSWPFSARSIRS